VAQWGGEWERGEDTCSEAFCLREGERKENKEKGGKEFLYLQGSLAKYRKVSIFGQHLSKDTGLLSIE